MDDYLKIKLDKLKPTQKQSIIKYLLGARDAEKYQHEQEIELCLMSDFTEAAIERNKNWGKMQGLSTGYSEIDRLTKGLVAGEMIVMAGKTSYGKTSLAINIANNVALKGNPVLFVSLEMSKDEVASRYMHINGGDSEDYASVSAITAMQHNDELSWQSIDGLVDKAVKEMNVKLIILDHLHYFTRELERISEDLGRITKEIKKNAIRHNVPIILISHVRRMGKQEEASIDDLRGSSLIGQDADIVLLIGRDKDAPEKMYVKIEKNRNRGYDYNDDKAELEFKETKIVGEDIDLPDGW